MTDRLNQAGAVGVAIFGALLSIAIYTAFIAYLWYGETDLEPVCFGLVILTGLSEWLRSETSNRLYQHECWTKTVAFA